MNTRTMNFELVIERQMAALMRVVASIFAMAGLASGLATGRTTMPRHLRNAVCKLLRPAESVARRIIFAAARNITVTLPPPRPKNPSLDDHLAQMRALGLAAVVPASEVARLAALARRKAARKAAKVPGPARYLLPLVERLRNLGAPRAKKTPPHRAPRIMFLDDNSPPPFRLPPPPSRNDEVSTTRLVERVKALANLREDMDLHIKRLARWTARRKAGLIRRMSSFKPGRAPGAIALNAPKRGRHEVFDLLLEAQWLASEAYNDTS